MSLVGSLSSSYADSIIPISGNVIISNVRDTQFPNWPGADIGFFVSGSVGSAGGNVRTTSLFGGDLVVSGNVGLKRNLSIDGDMTVLGTLTTINSVNLEVYDSVVGFGFSSGTIARPAGDRGWVGGISGGDNVGLLWKESAGEFAAIKTESSATGTLDVKSYANFHAARGTFTELTGSLTRLSDGSPFIVATSSSLMPQVGGISISTGSSGQISASYYVFPDNLFVSLSSPNKYFGRYKDGDTIEARGKTPAEVIKMAIVEPKTPDVRLATSSTPIELKQPYPLTITVNYGHEVKSLGATISPSNPAQVSWRRNGTPEQGGTNNLWVALVGTQNTNQSGDWTYIHTITGTDVYNSNQIEYKYDVIDSVGGTGQATANKTITYNPPTVSGVTIVKTNNGINASGSSPFVREIGNVGSEVIFTINKNATYVPLVSYSLQYRALVGGSWTSWSQVTSDSIVNTTTISYQHTPSQSTATQLQYQVVITDAHTAVTIGLATINLYPVAFYGSSPTLPTDSPGVRALPGYRYVNNTTSFYFLVGNTYNCFTIALPSTHKLIGVESIAVDLNGTQIANPVIVFPGPNDITQAYTLSTTFTSINANGTVPLGYKIYQLNPAGSFTAPDTKHVVTWGLA